ncbi:unnamed protein product, partial [Scytosiphon promiscuus]
EALRLEIKDAACRLLPSWGLRKRGGDLGPSFPAAVSRLLRGAPAPKPSPLSSPLFHGRRRCLPMPDSVQDALTSGANMTKRHRQWDTYQTKLATQERKKRKAGGQGTDAGQRPVLGDGGGGGGSGGADAGGSGSGGSGASEQRGDKDGSDRDDGVAEDQEEEDGGGGGSGVRASGVGGRPVEDAPEEKEGASSAGAERDELRAREWRMPPTCYICHLPLASMCECTAGSLDVERQFWEQRVAVVAGRPLQIDLGMPDYRDDRIQGVQNKRQEVAQHRRAYVTNRFRMEHSVAMQNRGILRHPLALVPSPPLPPPPVTRGGSLVGEGDKETETPAPTDASRTTTTTTLAAAAAAVTTEEPGAARHDDNIFDDYVPAAAESDEDSELYEPVELAAVDQPSRDDDNAVVPSEATSAAE